MPVLIKNMEIFHKRSDIELDNNLLENLAIFLILIQTK